MTISVYRQISAAGVWSTLGAKVYRNINAAGVWGGDPFALNSPIGYKVLRSPSGPAGLNGAQDVGWTVSGGLGAGEVLNTPPLERAASYGTIKAHSDSGFADDQTLTVQQKRAGSVIATHTLAVHPSETDWSGPAVFAGDAADVFALVLPDPADSQCLDLSVSLGSTS